MILHACYHWGNYKLTTCYSLHHKFEQSSIATLSKDSNGIELTNAYSLPVYMISTTGACMKSCQGLILG